MALLRAALGRRLLEPPLHRADDVVRRRPRVVVVCRAQVVVRERRGVVAFRRRPVVLLGRLEEEEPVEYDRPDLGVAETAMGRRGKKGKAKVGVWGKLSKKKSHMVRTVDTRWGMSLCEMYQFTFCTGSGHPLGI